MYRVRMLMLHTIPSLLFLAGQAQAQGHNLALMTAADETFARCLGLSVEEAQRRTTAAAGMTEAPGKQPAVSPDLAGELRAGKTVVRDIDWVAAKAEVSAAGAQGFKEAMTKLGRALKEGGGKFRLDLYLDQRYDESSAKMVGEQRFPVIQAALIEGSGDPSLTVQTGKVARDADPRLEISRIK